MGFRRSSLRESEREKARERKEERACHQPTYSGLCLAIPPRQVCSLSDLLPAGCPPITKVGLAVEQLASADKKKKRPYIWGSGEKGHRKSKKKDTQKRFFFISQPPGPYKLCIIQAGLPPANHSVHQPGRLISQLNYFQWLVVGTRLKESVCGSSLVILFDVATKERSRRREGWARVYCTQERRTFRTASTYIPGINLTQPNHHQHIIFSFYRLPSQTRIRP